MTHTTVTKRTRTSYRGQVVLWLGMYVVLILAPLALASIGHDGPARGFWVEFAVGLGFVGLAMMGLQFVLTARLRHIATPFGTDAMLQFHRQAGLGAYWFILGHAVIVLLADPQRYLAFLDPRVNAPRAVALVTVLVLLTLLIAFTLWREKFRLTYEWWRLSHGMFALLVVFIGLAHVMMVGFYVSALWQRVLWVGLTLAAMGLLIHARLVKPMLARRRPYRVVAVRPEVERVWTLEIAPDGHEGLAFEPGQFAWLALGSAFSLEQHPFTIASSAEQRGAYLLTIKELGDFSRAVRHVEPGTRAFLEGPYGAFTLDPDPRVGAVMIVGGIGVTPAMSMLRTMRDRGDRRPVVLIYGAARREMLVFRDELDAMRRDGEIDLTVVYVLEEAPPDWAGETGYITPEVLERHCPPAKDTNDAVGGDGADAQANRRSYDYFVCGPEPMMDMVESALRDRGVPLRRLHAERFKIV